MCKAVYACVGFEAPAPPLQAWALATVTEHRTGMSLKRSRSPGPCVCQASAHHWASCCSLPVTVLPALLLTCLSTSQHTNFLLHPWLSATLPTGQHFRGIASHGAPAGLGVPLQPQSVQGQVGEDCKLKSSLGNAAVYQGSVSKSKSKLKGARDATSSAARDKLERWW